MMNLKCKTTKTNRKKKKKRLKCLKLNVQRFLLLYLMNNSYTLTLLYIWDLRFRIRIYDRIWDLKGYGKQKKEIELKRKWKKKKEKKKTTQNKLKKKKSKHQTVRFRLPKLNSSLHMHSFIYRGLSIHAHN